MGYFVTQKFSEKARKQIKDTVNPDPDISQ